MKLATRYAACALGVLIASLPATPAAAAWDDGSWALKFGDVNGGTSQVEFKEVGIILSVTPQIEKDGQCSTEVLFLLEGDAIYLNVGTNREPRWETISEKEFWSLVAELEEDGFELIAEIVEDGYIVQVVLMF